VSSEAQELERARESSASLRLAAQGPLVGPVVCRVVSMVLARASCPMDRLDDALLVCDSLCAHAPAYASDGRLTFTVSASALGAQLRVGELAQDGARALVRESALPGVGNVLERIAQELRFEPSADGRSEELVVSLRFD
jgi:hypothetical protein